MNTAENMSRRSFLVKTTLEVGGAIAGVLVSREGISKYNQIGDRINQTVSKRLQQKDYPQNLPFDEAKRHIFNQEKGKEDMNIRVSFAMAAGGALGGVLLATNALKRIHSAEQILTTS